METSFEQFVRAVEPSLRRALAGHMSLHSVPDGLAEAFAYAWEHWETVRVADSPSAFLFKVAQSRSRRRRDGHLPPPEPSRLPHIEPSLAPAMRRLPPRQRSVVWLVHGCGWTYREVGEALDISPSAVGTHLGRAMTNLRTSMGVAQDA